MGRHILIVVVAALAAFGLLAPGAAHATHQKTGQPVYPAYYVNCSSEQIDVFEQAYRRAYQHVTAADALLDYIASRPAADRSELWSRDMDSWLVPSPRRYFGAYNADRFAIVRVAVEEARRRLRQDGDAGRRGGVVGIGSMLCRKKCASDPSAYHFPLGEIATCQKFWSRALEYFNNADLRIDEAAFTVVHEVFHWLRVQTGEYVTDLHGGSLDKAYGDADVTWLAESHPDWAVLNNDSYAYFAQAVNNARQPTFVGVLADKEAPSRGALISDMTLGELKAKIQQLGKPYQYLADVETYLRDGHRRYTGMWRIGCSPSSKGCFEKPGSLVALPRTAFVADFAARRSAEDLVDVEVYRSDGEWVFLGVYRPRKPGAIGVGGIQSKLSWEGLVDKEQQFRANAHLVDVETWLDGDQRRFTGVWAAGKVAGRLYRSSDPQAFEQKVIDLGDTLQLTDYESYKSMRVGVFSKALVRGRPRIGAFVWDEFTEALADLWHNRTLIDVEEYSSLPTQVLTAVPTGFTR